ncbi:hypothetical protein [Roseovarius sp. EL26]|uniref:hypothetical protein n=1 Tax=Roseovarius sp. EL26 TaxID=2126672 RepID=UPI000EA2EB1B|nr:hypothetical protein [Roseovarius sp. EL26]
MSYNDFGTIAVLEYRQKPKIGFSDIVEEFDIAFQMADTGVRSLTWDCDDVAILDRETLRIALGWLKPNRPGNSWHLVIAVGSSPQGEKCPPTAGYFEAMSQHIVEHTNSYLPYDTVMQGEASCAIGSDLIDLVADLVDDSSDQVADNAPYVAPDDMILTADDEPEQSISLVSIGEKISLPKRLTIYTLSCSFLLQVPAIGAFMLVYSLLRDVSGTTALPA